MKKFFKAAGRFLKSILPAFLFFETLLFSFSTPAFASSGALVEVKPSPSVSVDESVSSSVNRSYYYKQLVEWIQDRGYNAVRSSMDADLYYFFTVLVSDTYGVSTGSYKYPDGRVVSGSAYPIRAKSGDVYLNAFNPDYLHAYFDIFKLSMNDSSSEAISCCKSIYSGYMGCPNTNSAVALTSKLYPIAYSFDGFSDYYNALYSDYLVDNGDSGKSVGYEDLNPSDFVEDPKIPSDVFNTDILPTLNTQFYPKNATGKMSYRTDSRFHNYTLHAYYQQETFYSQGTGFIPVGGGNEMYALFFYKTDTDTYYSKLQLHFVITENEVWYEDRDEIEHIDRILTCEYWDMIDGSQNESNSVVLMDTGSYGYIELVTTNLGSFCVYAYDKYEDYIAYKNRRFNSLNQYISDLSILFKPDMSLSIDYNARNSTLWRHFTSPFSEHDSSCSFGGQCDFGYVASATPISAVYDIDTSRIPDDHYITVNGDTIYDYSITNPVTGDTTTIRNYVTNNYNFPKDESGNGGTSGNVTVSGQIDVSGTVSVDVNVDVNLNGGAGGGGNHYEMPDTSFFDDYLDDALEESTGIRRFIADFFDSMPGQITKLIGIGLVLAILCRLIGR